MRGGDPVSIAESSVDKVDGVDVVEGNDGDCDGNKSCLLPNDVSLSFNSLNRFPC